MAQDPTQPAAGAGAPRTHPARRAAGLAALAAGAVALVGPARRRSALLREVAPDLRSPLLLAPTDLTDLGRLRLARRLIVRESPVVAGVEVTERLVPALDPGRAVRVLSYEAPGRPTPSGALIWIHGGGMVMGRPEAANQWCSRLAADLGLLVLNVDYRLAPEHPFPAGLDDVVAVLSWLHQHVEALGVDPARVVVGGDSAGGGLAASTSQAARHRDLPIALQLLVYPMLDDRTTGRGPDGSTEALLWTGRSNRFAWHAYHGGSPTPTATGEHPAAARTEDLTGLAPAWMGIGDIDLFHDEAVAYAERLRAAGVACDLQLIPGLFHGADQVLPNRPTTKAFRAAAVAALRHATAEP